VGVVAIADIAFNEHSDVVGEAVSGISGSHPRSSLASRPVPPDRKLGVAGSLQHRTTGSPPIFQSGTSIAR
jgi:hypothetical protein